MATEDQNLGLARYGIRCGASSQCNLGVSVFHEVLIECRHVRIGCFRRLCPRLLSFKEPRDHRKTKTSAHCQSSSLHRFLLRRDLSSLIPQRHCRIYICGPSAGWPILFEPRLLNRVAPPFPRSWRKGRLWPRARPPILSRLRAVQCDPISTIPFIPVA